MGSGFAVYSQALLAKDPSIASDLIIFMGTVARLAQDHPGPAWSTCERNVRANAVADPSTKWNKPNQEVSALDVWSPRLPRVRVFLFLCQRGTHTHVMNGSKGHFAHSKHAGFVMPVKFVLSPQQLSLMAVKMKSSKTDQFGKGIWLHVQCTRTALCTYVRSGHSELCQSARVKRPLTGYEQPLMRSYVL